MSSISSIGSSTRDSQFAQSLINSTGSSTGALSEAQLTQLLENNPQLAQGLSSVEGGDSSTTIDSLYQKLSDGNGSISVSQLGNALGMLRQQMQASGRMPPPPPDTSGTASPDPSASLSASTTSTADISGSTTIGELVSDEPGSSSEISCGGNSARSDSNSSGGSSTTSSTSDSDAIVALLQQLLKEMQQGQGYDASGRSPSDNSLSVFQTST